VCIASARPSIRGVMSSLCDDTFYSTLTVAIGHIRRQQKLVADIKSICPTVASTRWLSLGRVTKWLSKYRDAVIRHLDEKAPACAPPPSWWVLLLAVGSEQDAMLDELAGDLRDILVMNGPISNGALMEMSKDDACVTSKELSAE
jgi:hypothetical protein